MKTLLFIILFATLVFPDNIYLRDGTVIRNCKITSASPHFVTFRDSTSNLRTLPSSMIANYEYTEITNKPESNETTLANDPCNDKVLLRLQAKDSLSTDEMKAYVELKKLCSESNNFNKTNKNQAQLINNLHDAQSGISTYLLVSLLLGVVTTIIILAH